MDASSSSEKVGISGTPIAGQVTQLLQETIQVSPAHSRLLWDLVSQDPKLVCKLANGILKEGLDTTGTTNENVEEQLKATFKLLKMESYEVKLNRVEQNITIKPVEEVKARLKGKIFPPDVLEMVEECALKLSSLGTRDYDYRETKALFDWLTSLPWGIRGGNNYNFDYDKAAQILDANVYGLDDTKKNVLEFIRSVEKNTNNSTKKILCLVGPAGTGKSVLTKTMAEIMERKYANIQCMGITDRDIIKGSSNYSKGLGKPGIILRYLKELQSENPIFLIKNLDQICSESQVSSEVLQFLHPNQNAQFIDSFLQTMFDFSNILFVCTSQSVEGIPTSLLPFADIIFVPGCVSEEKQVIVNKNLIPQILDELGLSDVQVTIEAEAMKSLLNHFSLEPGVAALRSCLNMIILRSLGENPKGKFTVETTDVKNILSTSSNVFSNIFVPLAKIGLARTACLTPKGGEACFIEASFRQTENEGGNQTILIGFQSTKISEIVAAALTYALNSNNIENVQTSMNRSISINFRTMTSQNVQEVDSTANSKEIFNRYRSIGGAVVVAIWSIINEIALSPEVGILAEVTATGLLLPLDHVEERIKALVRAGVNQIILPQANEDHIKMLPDVLQKFVKFHAVSDVKDVVKIVSKIHASG